MTLMKWLSHFRNLDTAKSRYKVNLSPDVSIFKRIFHG